MKMSNDPAKYEVLIEQYVRSVLDISVRKGCFQDGGATLSISGQIQELQHTEMYFCRPKYHP